MKLPSREPEIPGWQPAALEEWRQLGDHFRQASKKAGQSPVFSQKVDQIIMMVQQGTMAALGKLIQERVGVRALTYLWLDDPQVRKRTLRVKVLDHIATHHPRLTRITLLQVIQLYFKQFDNLDDMDTAPVTVRQRVEEIIRDNLAKLNRRGDSTASALDNLKEQADLFLRDDAPRRVAIQVMENHQELEPFLDRLDLSWAIEGRFADICRTIYYLETLKEIPVGQWHPVMDELLKGSVNRAPYEGSQRVGHAALEILIDQTEDTPGEAWTNFILGLAGDPRIVGNSQSYVEWWQPLGEGRINKVRGWLSSLDITLFLKALEEYGEQSGKDDLQRMFPARKRFLEGLIDLGFVKQSRLMLGSTVVNNLYRIVGDDMRHISYAKLTMSDRAVIYLDCGDFHILEGSHSFKIWIYLAKPPHDIFLDYWHTTFSHSELTKAIPMAFSTQYPSLPVLAVTHNPNVSWQHKVISFLGEHGIDVDPEELLTHEDYRTMLNRYGIPYVSSYRTMIPKPQPLTKRIF